MGQRARCGTEKNSRVTMGKNSANWRELKSIEPPQVARLVKTPAPMALTGTAASVGFASNLRLRTRPRQSLKVAKPNREALFATKDKNDSRLHWLSLV